MTRQGAKFGERRKSKERYQVVKIASGTNLECECLDVHVNRRQCWDRGDGGRNEPSLSAKSDDHGQGFAPERAPPMKQRRAARYGGEDSKKHLWWMGYI